MLMDVSTKAASAGFCLRNLIFIRAKNCSSEPSLSKRLTEVWCYCRKSLITVRWGHTLPKALLQSLFSGPFVIEKLRSDTCPLGSEGKIPILSLHRLSKDVDFNMRHYSSIEEKNRQRKRCWNKNKKVKIACIWSCKMQDCKNGKS